MHVGLCFLMLHCGNGQTLLRRASHEFLSVCERKGSPTVSVGECLCAHVQLCVLTKKLTSLSVCATAGQIRAFVFPIQEKDS